MLKGKTAVVTGGSRGIGRAIVLKLAEEGMQVAFLYRSAEAEAVALCRQCAELQAKVRAYACDVSDEEQVKQTLKAIQKDFGPASLLVNNAGITDDGLIMTMKEESFTGVIDVNLKGAFLMSKHILTAMLRNKEGCIINISSVSGLFGNPGQCNYAAAKAGLIGLTKSIAKEYASRQIRCNAVAPGFIDSEMTKDLDRPELEAHIPLGRLGRTQEIAEAVAYLADADYVTGEVLRVDGGIAM